MTQRIWKYTLAIVDRQELMMPHGAEILDVADQFGDLCLWAMVDDTSGLAPMVIAIRGTGHPLDGTEGKHVRSVVMAGGALVWHVFA